MLTPLTLMPLAVTVVGTVFAAVLFSRYFSGRRRPHELIWAIAFSLFAIASAAQVFADFAGGWTAESARLFYLAGGILNVGFLGVGTMYLLFSRKVANVGLAVMLLITLFAAVVVFTVPVDQAALAVEPGYKAVVKDSILPVIMAATVNTIGTVLVVGGALYSGFVFLRKRIMRDRMIGVFLIALGTGVVAIGGVLLRLSGLDNPEYHYGPMLVGVVIMFVGYLKSISVTAPKPALEGALQAERTARY